MKHFMSPLMLRARLLVNLTTILAVLMPITILQTSCDWNSGTSRTTPDPPHPPSPSPAPTPNPNPNPTPDPDPTPIPHPPLPSPVPDPIPEPSPILAPTDLSLSAISDTQIKAQWKSSDDTIDGYLAVYDPDTAPKACDEATSIKLEGADNINLTISNLEAGRKYHIGICAYRVEGDAKEISKPVIGEARRLRFFDEAPSITTNTKEEAHDWGTTWNKINQYLCAKLEKDNLYIGLFIEGYTGCFLAKNGTLVEEKSDYVWIRANINYVSRSNATLAHKKSFIALGYVNQIPQMACEGVYANRKVYGIYQTNKNECLIYTHEGVRSTSPLRILSDNRVTFDSGDAVEGSTIPDSTHHVNQVAQDIEICLGATPEGFTIPGSFSYIEDTCFFRQEDQSYSTAGSPAFVSNIDQKLGWIERGSVVSLGYTKNHIRYYPCIDVDSDHHIGTTTDFIHCRLRWQNRHWTAKNFKMLGFK